MAEGNDHNGSGGDDSGVRYFDSDFSFEDHAAECRSARVESSGGDNGPAAAAPRLTGDDNDLLLPRSQSRFWDAFHTNHSAGKFYRPRRYLIKSFPCILDYLQRGGSSTGGDGDPDSQTHEETVLLEIGCGSGSSCVPIIRQFSEMERRGEARHVLLLACDSSPMAVDTTRGFVAKIMGTVAEGESSKFSFRAFVADPSLLEEESEASFLGQVKAAYYDGVPPEGCNGLDGCFDRGIADIVLMIFVLSAVMPSRVSRFLEHAYRTTCPGGRVCFRDYGLFDMPMLRFAPSAAVHTRLATGVSPEDPVFLRGEGTIARFFSVEAARELFESAGFVTLELRYCTVFNHKRKTGQRLKRVFIHGVFEKPR